MKNVVDTPQLIFIKTPDGSYTFHDGLLNENYHSIHGAKTESEYVYIKEGLAQLNKDRLRVLEMGFGTGLNAFLSWQFACNQQKSIYYKTLEKNPIPYHQLPVPEFISNSIEHTQQWTSLHSSDWNREVQLDSCFTINKLRVNLIEFSSIEYFDIVFFDAFAPSVQPELWTAPIFDKIFNLLNPGGILVTYSCAGIVKRNIQSAGFSIERLKGPPGKKHMLRAYKPS